jgi:hypothetical protein
MIVRVFVEPMEGGELSRRDKIRILRGQLTIFRKQEEQGIPIPLRTIRNTERLAISLESAELTA